MAKFLADMNMYTCIVYLSAIGRVLHEHSWKAGGLVLWNDFMFFNIYTLYHRVGRVLSFFPVVGIGTPPTPHPQASLPPSPGSGGGAHSLAREGLGESPNSDEGTYTVVLFIYTYFVLYIHVCLNRREIVCDLLCQTYPTRGGSQDKL
jgi:hypothetical protein